MEPPPKILVVKPSSLGDVVHSLPFLHALKATYPAASVHWVVARGLEGLLEHHPLIDRLWIIEKDQWKHMSRIPGTMREFMSLSQSLRSERFDTVVDLQGLFRSGLISLLAGSPRRIGFREGREGSRFFYTQTVSGGTGSHAVDRYLKIAASLGCVSDDVRFPFPPVPPEADTRLSELLPSSYAVLIPGARWETKRWPAERFADVAAALPLPSVVIGGRDDIALADTIRERVGRKVVSLAGSTSLVELIAVVRRARLVLTNDTGPMHIAAALNVPVFALFGPTSPMKTGPYGERHTIIRSALSCAPCFKKKCGHPRCMLDVEASAVTRVILASMDGSP